VRVVFEMVRRRKPSAPVDDGVSPSGEGGIKVISKLNEFVGYSSS